MSEDEDRTPWPKLYALLIGELAVLTGLFWALSRWAS